MKFWGSENPKNFNQRPLRPQKCTVWCRVMSDKVIELYFFEDEAQKHSERITGAVYRTIIENFLRPAVEENQAIWFQQDGATAHTAGETMNLLREIFVETLSSKNAEFSLPPR